MMYQFFALVEEEGERQARRVPIEGDLQRELAQEMDAQRATFLPADAEILPYEPGYKPDDEVFVLKSYPLPTEVREALETPDLVPSLRDSDLEEERVKALFAVRIGKPRAHRIVFQSFHSGQVLHRGRRFLFLERDTFQGSDRSGLRIDDKLTALFEGGDLYFRSEHLVRRYLELDAYFQEATDDDIAKLLEDEHFAPADGDKILGVADRWMRRKITSIRSRGILDRVSVSKIAQVGKDFGVKVGTQVVDGKRRIVLSEDKKPLKALLRLLDEDLLDSPLTDARYQVSSKRRI